MTEELRQYATESANEIKAEQMGTAQTSVEQIARDVFMGVQFSADDGAVTDDDREPFIAAFVAAWNAA
jgi:hypothetical protein